MSFSTSLGSLILNKEKSVKYLDKKVLNYIDEILKEEEKKEKYKEKLKKKEQELLGKKNIYSSYVNVNANKLIKKNKKKRRNNV